MRSTLLTILTSILCTMPVEGVAAVVDGNELHDMCRSEDRMALTYVAGVIDQRRRSQKQIIAMTKGQAEDLAMAYVDVLEEVTQKACMPLNFKLEQARDVVCKYLDSNPAVRHEDGSLLTVKAFADAWPCKK